MYWKRHCAILVYFFSKIRFIQVGIEPMTYHSQDRQP
jgi:hypothetical protein